MTSYVAKDFRGRGTYRKEPRPTLEGAVLAAAALIATRNFTNDPTGRTRPVTVHADDGALIDTVYPGRAPASNT